MGVIKFVLNHLSRPTIQRIVHILTPLTELFYIGNSVECPVCGRHFRKFLPYGYAKTRPSALCQHCLSLERHRLLWLYLTRETDLLSSRARLLHVAPERCFMKPLESALGDDYITADLESPLAKVKLDIQEMPFADNSFPRIICNHILEHVESDIKALEEIYRVMQPGGWGIIMSPIDYRNISTREDPTATTPEQRLKVFGQADHLREYGRDYAKRLEIVGFKATEIHHNQIVTPEEFKRYSLSGDRVYRVDKPL